MASIWPALMRPGECCCDEPEGSMSMIFSSGTVPVQSAFDYGILRARSCGPQLFPEQKRWNTGLTASFVMRGSQVRVL